MNTKSKDIQTTFDVWCDFMSMSCEIVNPEANSCFELFSLVY